MIMIYSWTGQILCGVSLRHSFYKLPKRRFIFHPMKYEHNDVGESIDSDETNVSSIGFAE